MPKMTNYQSNLYWIYRYKWWYENHHFSSSFQDLLKSSRITRRIEKAFKGYNIFLVSLTFLSADRVANCESELTVPEKIFEENSIIYYHEVEARKRGAYLKVSHLTTPSSSLQINMLQM